MRRRLGLIIIPAPSMKSSVTGFATHLTKYLGVIPSTTIGRASHTSTTTKIVASARATGTTRTRKIVLVFFLRWVCRMSGCVMEIKLKWTWRSIIKSKKRLRAQMEDAHGVQRPPQRLTRSMFKALGANGRLFFLFVISLFEGA